jgi:addiction module RelB/DinJ family antitoxin
MSAHTKTILNIKVDKSVKKAAQDVAKELGVPLGTAITAFLKQFIREKELTLSANKDIPTPYLQKVIKDAEDEYVRGESSEVLSEKAFINHLKSL